MYVIRQVVALPQGPNQEEQKDERWCTLCNLLNRNRICFHIDHTEGRRANHLSHYLVALYKLGASSRQLVDSFRQYQDRVPLIPAIPSTSDINESNWQDYIGKKTCYMDFCEFYMRQLSVYGLSAVLDKYVPYLLTAVETRLFHGVIQLGYGLEVMYAPTIAEGLAYWTHSYSPLGNLDENSPKRSLNDIDEAFDILNELRCDEAFNDERLMNREGLLERFTYLGEHMLPQMAPYDITFDIVGNEEGNEHRVNELVDMFVLLALKIFASLGCTEFFTLHLVTGMRALKIVLREMTSVQPKLLALRYYWRAIVALFIATDKPELSNVTHIPVDWSRLISACSFADHPSHDDIKTYREMGQTHGSAQERTKEGSETTETTGAGAEKRKRGGATPSRLERLKCKTMDGNDAHLAKLVFVCLEEAEERRRDKKTRKLCLAIAATTAGAFCSRGWTFLPSKKQKE